MSSAKQRDVVVDGHPVPVYETCAQTSPFVYGVFHPVIIVPDSIHDPGQLANILRHERQHVKNHDAVFKIMMQVLTCLYWWFPPVYLLKAQCQRVIELHVDCQVVHAMPDTAYEQYLTDLVQVTRILMNPVETTVNLTPSEVPMFVDGEQRGLKQRVEFLLEQHHLKSTNLVTLTLIVIVPYLMTSVIIEPDYVGSDKVARETKEIKNDGSSYVLVKDGKYFLVIDNQNMGQIKSRNHSEINKLEVRRAK